MSEVLAVSREGPTEKREQDIIRSMSAGCKPNVWPNGKVCAVTLSYDGALAQHLNTVVPLLESLELRATFFASPTRLLDDPLGWKKAAYTHEIGNHSLFGVADGGTLLNWNLAMVEADVKMTNALVQEILGQSCRSFALPGWSTACAEGDYLPTIQQLLPFVRSDRRETNLWDTCDLGFTGSYPGQETDSLKIIQSAKKSQGWCVLRYPRITDEVAHEQLLRELASQRDKLWIVPFAEAAERIAQLRVAPIEI